MKSVSVPLAFVLGLLFMLVALGIFWLAGRAVSEETVFWQAIDNNLNSRSLILDTEVKVPGVRLAGIVILNSQLGFNFAPETSFGWRQAALRYDQGLANTYGFGPRSDQYYEEWYEQTSCGSGTDVYLRHDLHARPTPDGWREQLDSLGLQPAFGQDVTRVATEGPDSLQHFMMHSLANGSILLHGKLPPEERRAIVDQLRAAYSVDFENVRTVKAGGRLLYEYDVEVDYGLFVPAFVAYFNATLADESQRRELPAGEATGNRSVTHTVVVDAWSRQITEVRHPLELHLDRPINSLDSGVLPDGDFIVTPYYSYYSDLIEYLSPEVGTDMRVVTRILNRNQRIDTGRVASSWLQERYVNYDNYDLAPRPVNLSRIDECK